MRNVFLALLTANLLFLAWAKWVDSPPEAGSQDALSRLPRLQLVSEAPPGPKPTPASETSEPTEVSPTSALAEKVKLRATDAAKTCTSVGPFNDITSAARVAGLLSNRGFPLVQRAEEGETIEGYWVFVGGMQSEDDVKGVVERLEKNGFTDAHIMMKSASANRRVSVGMFTSRDRAEKRAAAVKRMGLEAEVGERKFPGTVYWVDVTLKKGVQTLPPEYAFAELGQAKVGIQPCPPGARPSEPGVIGPGDEGDGVTRRLPRTTVATGPKRVP